MNRLIASKLAKAVDKMVLSSAGKSVGWRMEGPQSRRHSDLRGLSVGRTCSSNLKRHKTHDSDALPLRAMRNRYEEEFQDHIVSHFFWTNTLIIFFYLKTKLFVHSTSLHYYTFDMI